MLSAAGPPARRQDGGRRVPHRVGRLGHPFPSSTNRTHMSPPPSANRTRIPPRHPSHQTEPLCIPLRTNEGGGLSSPSASPHRADAACGGAGVDFSKSFVQVALARRMVSAGEAAGTRTVPHPPPSPSLHSTPSILFSTNAIILKRRNHETSSPDPPPTCTPSQVAMLTDMSQPLGETIGNWLELQVDPAPLLSY